MGTHSLRSKPAFLSLLQPSQLQTLPIEDIQKLIQMQGRLILESSESARADSHRFEHLSQIFLMSNAEVSKQLSQFVEVVAHNAFCGVRFGVAD